VCFVFAFLLSGLIYCLSLITYSNATVLSDALKELDEDREKETSSSSEDEEDMLDM